MYSRRDVDYELFNQVDLESHAIRGGLGYAVVPLLTEGITGSISPVLIEKI